MAGYWYYLQNGNQGGPTDQATLQRLLVNGQLSWGDLVWNETMTAWAAADQVPELAASKPVVAPTAAPPPFQPPQAFVAPTPASSFAGPASPVPGPIAAMPVAPVLPLAPAQSAWGGGSTGPASPVFPERASSFVATGDVSGTAVQLLVKTRTWVRLMGILAYVGAAIALLGGLLALVTTVRMGTGIGVALVALAAYIVVAGLVAGFGALLNRYAARITVLQTTRQVQALEQALDAQRLLWKIIGILVTIGIAINILVLVVALVTLATTWMSRSF